MNRLQRRQQAGNSRNCQQQRRERLLVYLLEQPRKIVDAGRVGVTHKDKPELLRFPRLDAERSATVKDRG